MMIKEVLKAIGVDDDDSFIMTNTSTSYVFFDFFKKKLGKLKFKSVAQEFSRVFAITVVFKTMDYSYRDTDVPQECENILNELGKRWLKLLGEKEEDCGYTGENAVQYIIDYLNELKSEMEEGLGEELELETWVESEGEKDEESDDNDEDEDEE